MKTRIYASPAVKGLSERFPTIRSRAGEVIVLTKFTKGIHRVPRGYPHGNSEKRSLRRYTICIRSNVAAIYMCLCCLCCLANAKPTHREKLLVLDSWRWWCLTIYDTLIIPCKTSVCQWMIRLIGWQCYKIIIRTILKYKNYHSRLIQ